MIGRIHFANPEYFWLLILLPLLIVWYWRRNHLMVSFLRISTFNNLSKAGNTWRVNMRHLPFTLELFSLLMIVTGLARPQTNMSRKDIQVEGIDIVMATDISSTMLAEDLKPNRLEAAKDVGIEFINKRENDRIALVVFSGEAFTQCPLTTDHQMLISQFKALKFGLIDDGTAIGDGIATAVNRLKDSKAKSKVIILLTDGKHNAGSVDPGSAAEMASLYKIRIYTIGVGTSGFALTPSQSALGITMQKMPVEIDEELLAQLSGKTGGKYFRATDKQKLADIYTEIDKLEKSKVDVTEYQKKKEQFLLFVILGMISLGLSIVLKNSILKTLN